MMPKEAQITPINTILCDDIRKEDSGKDLLIGVYSGTITVNQMPANIVVALWMQCKTSGKGRVDREVRVIDSEGRDIMHGKFSAEIITDKVGYMSAALNKMILGIGKPGQIKFQWRKTGEKWKTLLVKEINIDSTLQASNAVAKT